MSVDYRIGDALEILRDEPAGSAAFIHLDDAWARPNRNGAFGVKYPTHPFDESDADAVAGEPGVETGLTVVDMLEAGYRVLESGGVLAVDVDGYLCPRVLTYAVEEWGRDCYAVHETTLLTKDGEPDRSTPGMYGSSGGYSTVLIWRDTAPLPQGYAGREFHSLRCACRRQHEDWGWGTVKPLAPALQWIQTYTDAGDRVIVPCAGTAPVAVAAEREYGSDADVLAIDVEPGAKSAYERRRSDELDWQGSLSRWVEA